MNIAESIARNVQTKNVLLSQQIGLVNKGKQNSPEWRKLDAAIKELEETIATQRKLAGKQDEDHRDNVHTIASALKTPQPTLTDETRAAQNRAWFNYLTKGETRDLTVTSGNAVINQEFSSILFDAAKAYGPIAGDVTRLQDNGVNPVKAAFYDDTASYLTLVGETSDTSVTATDPANIYSDVTATDSLVSSIQYSFQMESDAGFDFGNWLQSVAAIRVGRSLEYAISTGKDNPTAQNALPQSPVGGLVASLQSAGNMATTGAIGYGDLHKLFTSIDPAYRLNGSFYAHSSVADYLSGELDGFGRPYYKVNPNTGNLILVAGKELKINQAMPVLSTSGTGTPQVIFGDFSKAYAVNLSDIRIKVLRERYATSLIKAALVFVRLGATAGITGAAKALLS